MPSGKAKRVGGRPGRRDLARLVGEQPQPGVDQGDPASLHPDVTARARGSDAGPSSAAGGRGSSCVVPGGREFDLLGLRRLGPDHEDVILIRSKTPEEALSDNLGLRARDLNPLVAVIGDEPAVELTVLKQPGQVAEEPLL